MNYKAISFGKLTLILLSFAFATFSRAQTIENSNYDTKLQSTYLSQPENHSISGFYLTLGGAQVDLNFDEQSFGINESLVGLGYQASSKWSFELSYLNSTFDENALAEVNYRALDLSTIYDLGGSARTGFHLRTGIGIRNFDSSTLFSKRDTTVKLGAGYNVRLNSNLFISLAAESHRRLEQETTDSQLLVNINYFWDVPSEKIEISSPSDDKPNVEKTVNPLSPLDSDFDGVYDLKDLCPDTPLHYLVDSNGCEVLVIDKETVTLEINFAFDSVEVSSEFFGQIESIARFLSKHSHLTLTIEGHTDNQGTPDYNLKLSQDRANAVKELLVDRYKIDAQRLKAVGYGDTQPLESNMTEDGQKKNRRVQAVLSIRVEKPQLK